MQRCVILAQDRVTANALEEIWKLVTPVSENDVDACKLHKILLEHDSGSAAETYEKLVWQLRAVIDDHPVPPAKGIILVDHIRVAELNPIRGNGWSAAIAMLVLTFPEMRWIFGVASGTQQEWDDIVVHHSLASLFTAEKDLLFDFFGLRDFLLGQVKDAKDRDEHYIAPYIPRRVELSAALDDEKAYAYFHAYAAYRYGFRSVAVLTDALAKELFSAHGYLPKDLGVCLEDLFLNYPDRPGDQHYLDLTDDGNRNKNFPKLKQTGYRIFVTTGQRHRNDREKMKRNEYYIKSFQAAQSYSKMIFKPVGGLFDLWERSGLKWKLKWELEVPWKGKVVTRRGTGKKFCWPPLKYEDLLEGADTGHSAPGRLLVIAEHLIERAIWLKAQGVHSVSDAVRGAVFATNALELLGYRTPTTAIDALTLKHEFELEAECQFSGVIYHILIQPRLKDIRREISGVSRWFHPHQRKASEWNAEMTVLNALVTILREHNQFDEEQTCLNRIRHLHHSLWMRQQPWRFIFWPLLRYVEFLLASFGRFSIAIIGWVVVLTLLYQQLHVHHPAQQVDLCTSILKALELHQYSPPPEFDSFWEAFKRFFNHTAEPSGPGTLWSILTAIGVIAGLGHIGVFISYMYTLVARK